MNLINLVYVFCLIVLVKFVANFYKFLQTKYYHRKYTKWLGSKNDFSLEMKQPQVVKLFKDAGLNDIYHPVAENIGLNHVATANLSIFDNFPNADKQLVLRTNKLFYRATGVFYSRALESINPIYWIESTIHFPRNVFSYLGVDSERLIVRTAQLTYWAFMGIVGIFYSVYNDEVNIVVKEIIEKMLFN